MMYLFGLLVSAQIILGQVLWKIGVEKVGFQFSKEYIFSESIFKVLLNPYILLGILSYGFATILFMGLLSKYEYTNLQAIVVSSSLMFTFIAASLVFGEKISIVNLLGLVFLLIGVIFVTKF